MSNQIEITEPGLLLDEEGNLNTKGWSRKPLLKYKKKNLGKGWSRTKEWDYYAIINPNYAITFTITDLGIMGLYSVVWLDFRDKKFIPDEESKFFTKGRTNMSFSSEEGFAKYEGKRLQIKFSKKASTRKIVFDFPSFNKNQGIKGKLEMLQDPEMDSMAIATPWKNKPKCFYYNHKVNCMPTEGKVVLGNKIFTFEKENSFAVLDWGRGIWPYSDTWYWGSASGMSVKNLVGINIGYGFGDTSAASENIFYYNGIGHKLDQVTFHFNPKNFLEPWKFTSNDGRFEMEFEPIIDRNSVVNLLIFKSIQHQVFGYYTGEVILDDGRTIKIEKLLGFAEKVQNRW
ncbi:MAG: DUF2804 domain-containing protein [Candidatus Heimdallarchaeota archaeon]|nr:DUF2804 domain-containing protein [Candidatus Heimdallarchaeota archaeon]